MKRLSKIPYPAIITSVLLLTANAWHVFTQWVANPPGYTFTGIAHYYADYFLYVSTIVQGSHGATIFSRHLFTNEPMPETWIYWLYTLMGKFGYLGISPFVIYTASLFVFGGILLALLWKATELVFPQKPMTRFIAFLFLTTASHIPGLGDFWFSPTPALNRLGGVPHQMVQSILLLSVLMLFADFLVHPNTRRRWYVFLGLTVLSFLAATANPIQMLLVVAAVFFHSLVQYRQKSATRDVLSGLAVIAVPALCGALFTNASFAHDQILTAAKTWEDAQQVSVSLMQFIYAIGPLFVLIPFGISPLVKQSKGLASLLLVMGASSLLFFFSPLPSLLHTSPVRWLSPVSYMIVPLLATYGLSEIVRFFERGKAVPAWLVRDVLLIGYILCTIPSLISQIQARELPFQNNSVDYTLNHLSPHVSEMLTTIERTNGNNVVLTDPVVPIDVLIPLTGKKTFTGHPIHTLYPQTKDALRRAFFSGSMTESEAENFLRAHDIRYVVWNKQRPVSPVMTTLFVLRYQNDLGMLYERK